MRYADDRGKGCDVSKPPSTTTRQHVHRRPRKKDFEGKTIRQFTLQADNIWQFQFSDGSKLAIQSDNFGHHGIACMALCEVCA